MAEPYRPYKKVYSTEDVIALCKRTDFDESRTDSELISRFRPPFTGAFTGRELKFVFDNGSALFYRFASDHALSWSEDGVTYDDEYYEALESTAKNVYLIHHIRHSTMPYEGILLAVDMESELVTLIRLSFGTSQSDINVSSSFCFGYFGKSKRARHTFTDEMCGVILDWKYADNFVIRHEYISMDTVLSPGEPTDDEEAYLFRKALRANYIKIRKNLYIVTFAEDGGGRFVLLIDLVALHNVGAIYALGEKGLSSYMIGAVAGRGTFGFTGKYAIS